MEAYNSKIVGALKLVVLLIAIFPALYIFVAIQYGSVTVPYWDHLDFINTIKDYKSGSFQIAQLWEPHNHSRPLTYRLIYLVNAVLTDWDIRSEYFYMYIVIYGCFALHASILYTNNKKNFNLKYLAYFAILSFFYFSPVGHMNHWWSMMLQLQLGNLFILLALWILAKDPQSWRSNIFSALFCWLATYSITNGLFVFLVCAFLALIASNFWRQRLQKITFWLLNFILILALYLPGLPNEAEATTGKVFNVIEFSLVYLGLPLGGFLDFNFTGPFSHPSAIGLNAVCGSILIIASITLIFLGIKSKERTSQRFIFLVGCFLFATFSALATGMGRSDFGAVYGNSSRYAIYSSYIVFGLIHYFGGQSEGINSIKDKPFLIKSSLTYISLVVVILFGFKTYFRGIEVYRGAHLFNEALIQAYANPNSTIEELKLAYPDPEVTRICRQTLQRYNLSLFHYNIPASLEVSSP